MDSSDDVFVLAMFLLGAMVLILGTVVYFKLRRTNPPITIRVHSGSFDEIWDLVLKSVATQMPNPKSDKEAGTIRGSATLIKVSNTLASNEFEIEVQGRDCQKIISGIEENL
jgi:hypothetical protein